MSLSPSELERYSRQLSIRGFGVEGQKKLKSSKVVVVGVGGLGCLSSLYLAAAGVGRIVLVDKGRFTLKNLNRQVLCWQKDIGRFKAEVAKEKLEEFNPEIKVETVIEEITEESVQEIIGKTDVVVDGMDNWKTRFIVNEYCVKQHIPFVHAGVSEMHGQITTIMPGEGPCLRCIFPRNPPEFENIPILGATPAFFAALQVIEAVKLITGLGEPLVGRMLFIDGKEMAVEIVKMKRNANCPVCGNLYRGYNRNHVDESPLNEDKRIYGENMNSSETCIGSDIANLVEKGAEFHGHLGPFLVLGVRAGLAGLRELGVPRKFGQMRVTAKLKLSVPFSCFIDGVQITTNCTVGNRLLRLEDSQQGITVCFKPKDSDEELTIRVKPEILRYLMNKFSEGVSNEELAWEIASLPEDKLFTMAKQ